MTPYDIIINQQIELGRQHALDLRSRADAMDGTGIIAEENKIPIFDPKKNYLSWVVGAPVKELVDGEFQTFKLIQPYNAAHYTGTPSTLPALWSICHTKDPKRAKPYVEPNGISGMYMKDECYIEEGLVYRCKEDNVVHDSVDRPDVWEKLENVK